MQNGLTVVGCNPALPTLGYYNIPVFRRNSATDQQMQDLAALEFKARKSYPYYRPFHRLAAELGLPLEHVDLFFYRETKQANFQKLIFKADEKLNDFGQRQVELAVRLIVLSRPQIILVANALAARTFKAHFELKTLDDDGLYWVNLPE